MPEKMGQDPPADEPNAPGRVPNAKSPKTRPPSSLRDRLGILQASMPKYTGPYAVRSQLCNTPIDSPS